MKVKWVVIFLSFGSFAQSFSQDHRLSEGFKCFHNDLVLIQTARSGQYFDKIGLKAAVMGTVDGGMECWIWPWKVLRNFQLQFLMGTSTQPIQARDIVQTFRITPEMTVINYVYESFTVRQILFIPRQEPCVFILLEVHSTGPLTIVSNFIPVLQPQWPAGIGGQYSFWQDNVKAYVISESQRRARFLCGSPAGEKMAVPPAHMLADRPLQFKIPVQNGGPEDRLIPIVITGGSDITKDSLEIRYEQYLTQAENLYRRNIDYYKNFRNNTLQIKTPDSRLNLAFEWGKVALHNLMVSNPNLGTGLVAGYGLSGSGARPGFAWYFGGDAFINSLALNSFGDFETVRQALLFTQKWQRREDFPIREEPSRNLSDIGKMAHELSQSEGLVDWWNDYHYGYNHADTTPWYLVATGDYIKNSGDVDFLKKSWPSILQAYEWCLSKDSDNDGLMDLKGAGLGVLEFGPLVKIHNDIYTQGLWTQGLKDLIWMSQIMGDTELQSQIENQYEKAKSALEKIYWLKKERYYSFGANEEGDQVREKSIWPVAAIMFQLLDKDRSISTLKAFSGSDMVTDWGIRNLSRESRYYQPTNYNYGTVWPFVSAFTGTAQYLYGFNIPGWLTIKNTFLHIFNFSPGVVPELLSGEIYTKLEEAYHNQGFSVTGFMLPVIRGLYGLSLDMPQKRIIFNPSLPAHWNFMELHHCKLQDGVIHLTLKRDDDTWTLVVEKEDSGEWLLDFNPRIPLGTEIENVTLNDTPLNFKMIKGDQSNQLDTEFKLTGTCTLTYTTTPAVEIISDFYQAAIGDVNQHIKVLSQELKDKKLTLMVEGQCGKSYRLGVRNIRLIRNIDGGNRIGDGIEIHFEGKRKGEFLKKRIVLSIL